MFIKLSRLFFFIHFAFIFSATRVALEVASLGAGFGVWQEKKRYINTIDFSFRQDFELFSYELELSIFIPFDNPVFVLGSSNKETVHSFASLSNIARISNYIKEISYHDQNVQVGFAKKRVHFENTLAWGNPLLNQTTPFVGAGFYFETVYINVYTSALPDPSLMVMNSKLEIFSSSKNLLLRAMEIETSAYIDWNFEKKSSPNWGVGNDITTTYWQDGNHSLGLKFGFAFSDLKLRSELSSSYRFTHFSVGLGGIFQNRSHPNSPILSPLYQSRRQMDVKNQPDNLYSFGGNLFASWEANDIYSFSIDLNLYDKDRAIFSYRLSYILQFEDFYGEISYIRDSVTSFANFIDVQNPSSFFSFDLKAKVIHNLFEIGWSSYLGWDQQLILQSRLYSRLSF